MLDLWLAASWETLIRTYNHHADGCGSTAAPSTSGLPRLLHRDAFQQTRVALQPGAPRLPWSSSRHRPEEDVAGYLTGLLLMLLELSAMAVKASSDEDFRPGWMDSFLRPQPALGTLEGGRQPNPDSASHNTHLNNIAQAHSAENWLSVQQALNQSQSIVATTTTPSPSSAASSSTPPSSTASASTFVAATATTSSPPPSVPPAPSPSAFFQPISLPQVDEGLRHSESNNLWHHGLLASSTGPTTSPPPTWSSAKPSGNADREDKAKRRSLAHFGRQDAAQSSWHSGAAWSSSSDSSRLKALSKLTSRLDDLIVSRLLSTINSHLELSTQGGRDRGANSTKIINWKIINHGRQTIIIL